MLRYNTGRRFSDGFVQNGDAAATSNARGEKGFATTGSRTPVSRVLRRGCVCYPTLTGGDNHRYTIMTSMSFWSLTKGAIPRIASPAAEKICELSKQL